MKTTAAGRLAALSVAVAAAASAGPVWAATFVSLGDWGVASNWKNPANVPDTTAESAVINGGNVGLSNNYTIGSLTVTGSASQIYGTGTINTITTNTFGWTDGTLTNGVSVVVNGQADIAINSTLDLRAANLTLKGPTTLTGFGSGTGILFAYASTLTNAGTLSLISDFATLSVGGQSTFANAGTFNKTAGSGTATLDTFLNTGTLSSQSGTILANLKDGATSTGTFNATAGNTVRLANTNTSNGTHTLSGAKFTSAGVIDLADGTCYTGASTVTSTTPNLNLSGATLVGNYALTDLNFTGGQIGVAGTNSAVTISHATNITKPSNYLFMLVEQTTLTLAGTTAISGGTYNFSLRDGSTLINNGTLSLSGNTGIEADGAANGVINTGTIIKTAGGQSNIFGLTNNGGTVQAQTGTLYAAMKTGSTPSGTFIASAGATLQLSTYASSLTLGSNTQLLGQGTFLFSKNTTLNGSVPAAGMTLNVPDNSNSALGDLEIAGTIYSVTGPLAAAGFTKTGAGTLRLSGANTYAGATNVAAGDVVTTPPAYARILSNTGGLNFTGKKTLWTLFYAGDPSPLAQVRAILTAGYANNFTTGQIRSTVTNADLSIGFADDGRVLRVAPAIPGDANLDGNVDFNDFLALQNSFGQSTARWDGGDFNYSGTTDFNDFLVLQNHFGQTLNGTAVAMTSEQLAAITAFGNTAAVPEPAGVAAAAFVLIAAARRRKAE